MYMETNSSSLLILKCEIMQHPITKQALETDYVMKLLSTITTELPNPDWGISGVHQWHSHGMAIGVPMAYPWHTYGIPL